MRLILFLLFVAFSSCTPTPEQRADFNATFSVDDRSVEHYQVEKLFLKTGGEIYNPISCIDHRCRSLFEEVAQQEGVDPASLIEQAILKGNPAASRKIIPLPTDPRLSNHNISPPSQLKTKAIEKPDSAQTFTPIKRTPEGNVDALRPTGDARLNFVRADAAFSIPTLKEGVLFKIGDIEDSLGTQQSSLKKYAQRQRGLTESSSILNMSQESISFELTRLDNTKTGTPLTNHTQKVLKAMQDQVAYSSHQVNSGIQKLGESIAFKLTYDTARSAQLAIISTAKNADGTFRYPETVRAEAAKLAESGKKTAVSEALSAAMNENQLTLMMRKVSDQGFMALVEGRPSKRLQLKAKSDSEGNIPVNQLFSHKVKGQGDVLIQNRAMFNEFSFQSRAELLADGLPNSFNKSLTKVIELSDGEKLEMIGIKGIDDAPDIPVKWVEKSTFDARPTQEKEQFAVYEVHADPRAMKGSTEALQKLWKSWRVDSGEIKSIDTPFTHLKNTDWEAEGGVDRSNSLLVKEKDSREQHLDNAEMRNLDYAEFVLRAEQVGVKQLSSLSMNDLYASDVTRALGGEATIKQLAAERLNTAGAIAPDIDLLSVGVKKGTGSDESFTVSDDIGRTSETTRLLLNKTTEKAEGLLVQQGIHHGSEDLNFEFPQNLKDDYPIGVVSTTGEAMLIPKAGGTQPHSFLFKYMREHPDMTTSINPAYIVKHASEFPTNKSRWPEAQIKKMQMYEDWIEVGVSEGGSKKGYFEELKQAYGLFKDKFSFVTQVRQVE